MNAHTPRAARAKPVHVMAGCITPAAAQCPVADLARQYTRFSDRDQALSELDPVDGSERYRRDRLGLELLDAADQASARAEWTPAESLEGVYFQLLCILSLAREVGDDAIDKIERANTRRRIDRLGALATERLEVLGHFAGEDYGKRHKTVSLAEFEEVLDLI